MHSNRPQFASPLAPIQDTARALHAVDLACGYGPRTVLSQINLDVAPGQMVALLGRNGCGKSTLLRALSGVLAPRHGTITLCGRSLQHIPRREVARLLAVVPQDLQVPFAFSVREVVELGRTPYARFLQGLSSEDRHAVEDALAATELSELSGRLFQHLSGGEQQRVALAMALAQQPMVLLLDEPTVHLDIAHQTAMLSLIRRLCDDHGLAVVAAMHDINLTCLYFDSIFVLGDGTLLAAGMADEIITPTLIERAFGTRVAVGRHPSLDVPQVNLLP